MLGSIFIGTTAIYNTYTCSPSDKAHVKPTAALALALARLSPAAAAAAGTSVDSADDVDDDADNVQVADMLF